MFVLYDIIVEPINCDWCLTKIPRPTRSQKYCNEKCRSDASNERKRLKKVEKKKILYHPVCPYCEKTITTTQKKRVYCDDECKGLFKIEQLKKKTIEKEKMKTLDHKIDPMFTSRNI